MLVVLQRKSLSRKAISTIVQKDKGLCINPPTPAGSKWSASEKMGQGAGANAGASAGANAGANGLASESTDSTGAVQEESQLQEHASKLEAGSARRQAKLRSEASL